MSDRVTIMLDEDLQKKIRIKQAKRIQTGESYSFSQAINDTLRESL